MDYLYQIPRIHDGLEHLLKNDPVFSKLGIKLHELLWPYMGSDFAGLVRIVIGQQVSTQAAQSMWNKFKDGLPCVTPNAVLVLDDDEMRSFGLSHQKASYIRGLAEAVRKGTFDFVALEHASDDEVYEAVTALKGFGDWSAEMYLMFGLARPDIFAPGDLGIQEGLRKYLNLDDRPAASEAATYGEQFKPYRTAASLLLWHLKAMQ